jgi:hypothetical protein
MGKLLLQPDSGFRRNDELGIFGDMQSSNPTLRIKRTKIV